MESEKIIKLPKVELHCHLDGSLPMGIIRELLGRDVKKEELQVRDDCRNLAEYLEKFDLPLSCMQTETGLKRTSKAFLESLKQDNIQYVEVRFAPLLSVNESLDCTRVIQSVLEGLEEAKKECGIYYNVIACAMRHHTEEDNLQMMKAARSFLGEGICAVDLAGNEAAFPMENFTELFQKAKKLGLPFTIHAGECGRVENVIEAVKCGASRIGHGIALRGHADAMAMCKEKQIGIEMCPISNLQTKAVASKSEYPMREFLDAGLCVTINTDNRTVSNSSIQKEMEFVQKNSGITALLGTGFDPGVTSVFTAYAQKHYFDEIHTIDILDCNGGDHGYPFATNFNPEINLREVSAPGSYWEDGHWVEIPAMSIKREYNFEGVGMKDMYLLHHEEIESLAKTIPGVKRIRFFMTFGQSYLDHMRCLEDVGMLSTTPIQYNGQEIVPIQFLKALLPDPASLGPRTKGKTNIGCIFTGVKDGKEKTYYIYNVCDHQECYHEVGSQAISYTTGVPAMCGALMMLTGKWIRPGVYTVEEFDPDPFLEALDRYGLPRSESHDPELVD